MNGRSQKPWFPQEIKDIFASHREAHRIEPHPKMLPASGSGMKNWTEESLLTLIRNNSPFAESAQAELNRRKKSK